MPRLKERVSHLSLSRIVSRSALVLDSDKYGLESLVETL